MSRTLIVGAATALFATMGCGGGGGEEPAPSITSSYRVSIAGADAMAIGPARFIFLLEDPRGRPVTSANVRLRFYFVDPVRGYRKTVKTEVTATQVELDKEYRITDADGNEVTLGPGTTGIFANDIAFDQAGDWIVDMTGSAGNSNLGIIEVPFAVSETAAGPRVGQPAPDVGDTRVEGPAMVIFGVPGLCTSEVCGPLVEIAQEVAEELGDEIEALFLSPGAADEGMWAAWGVGDEPALFFVDTDGLVRGRLQTIATYEQVAALARSVLP